MSVIHQFVRDFWRAMGDRNVHLAAYRQFALALLAAACILGLLAATGAVSRG